MEPLMECPHCGKQLTKGEVFRGVCKGCKGLVNEPSANPIRPDEAASASPSSADDGFAQDPIQILPTEEKPTYHPVSEDMLPPPKLHTPRNITAIIGERIAAAAWVLFLLAFVGSVPWFLIILASADDLTQYNALIKVEVSVTGAVFIAAAVFAVAALVVLIIGLCLGRGSRAKAISALVLSVILASLVISGWHQKAFDACYGKYLEDRLDDWKFEHGSAKQGPKAELPERNRLVR